MTWPITPVSTGDLVTAGQLNQLPIALAEIDGAADELVFSSIPPNWSHLLILAKLQSDSGANSDTLLCQANGDTGNTYIQQRLQASQTSVSGAGIGATNGMNVGEVPGGASGSFSSHLIFVAGYAVAQKHSFSSWGHAAWGTGATNQVVWISGGAWMPSTPEAIDELRFFPGTGGFVAGSTITLYGMGLL